MTTQLTDVYIYGYTGNEESLRDFAKSFSGENPYYIVSLPGFSDGVELTAEQQSDARVYSELVWGQITQKTQGQPIRIIGHSHGAIVTYCLAVAHEKDIDSIVLVCPVARPKVIVRIASRLLQMCAHIFGTERTLGVVSKPLFVDMVTQMLRAKSWSNEAYEHIRDIRRREAKAYNRTVIDCVKQIHPFHKIMDLSRSQVPAIILSTEDDKVAGKHDLNWYASRLAHARQIRTYGGHQCLVADPVRIAGSLSGDEVQ